MESSLRLFDLYRPLRCTILALVYRRVPGATGGSFGPPVRNEDRYRIQRQSKQDERQRSAEQAVQADPNKRRVFGFRGVPASLTVCRSSRRLSGPLNLVVGKYRRTTIMSLITELVALVTQLDASITDRKIRDLFLPVKEKILEVQRDQFYLERKHAEEMDALKASHTAAIAAFKNKQAKTKSADICQFCRNPTGELLEIKPHEIHGMNGLKVGFYQCSDCGKKYDHNMPFQIKDKD